MLVADVVGSTELFGRLGVDRADDARRALFAAFSTAIAAGEGVLIKTMGDGCLASFDAAADGVTAAVALQHAAAGLNEHKVPGLRLRVGMAVGDVTEDDGDVFGPAVVIAGRLCSAAGEEQILATDMVRMLAGDRGGHHYEAVGGLILKGIAEPVLTCTIRVDAAPISRALPAALAAMPAELLVGRSGELDVLNVAWRAATAGERRAVLIAGEPGIGKTRLAAAVARRAHDEGALVLFGRCEEDLAVAYQPVAEALRTAWAALDPDVVSAHLATHGGEIRRLVPAIHAAEPVPAEATLEQARLFDAVTDLLHRVADARPVMLVLDDLHWAAASTIALLRHLLGAEPNHRLCILGTYRDTEIDRSHALGGLLSDIHRNGGVGRLALRGLDSRGIEDLVMAASGDELDDESRALAAAIAGRTDGNPFFTNQVLRHLAERGVLVQDGGRWALNGSLDDVDLPEGVLDVVGRRLSRLSPAANQVLAVAALGGLDFGVRVLCEVADAGTPDAVVDGLDEAVRARLLVETGPGRFAFIHAIVRDALTRELTMAKRARMHRALGEAILVVFRDASDVPFAELARHFTEAAVLGDTATAARWATAAASAAADRADHRGAIAVLERTLAVIEAIEPVDQAARFEVAAALIERHFSLNESAPETVASAAHAARQLGSGARMLRVATGRMFGETGAPDPEGTALYEEAMELLDPSALPLRAFALAGRAWIRQLQGIPGFVDDVAEATALLPRIDASAPKVAAAVRGWLLPTTIGLPGAARRLQWCDEVMAVATDAEDPWWAEFATGIDFDNSFLMWRGQAMLALGRRSEFEATLRQLAELGDAIGHDLMRVSARAGVSLLALLDGRFADVQESADRMLEVATHKENHSASYFAVLGQVAIEQGRAADVVPFLEAGVSLSPDLPAMRAALARVRLDIGDRAGAADALAYVMNGWADWARDWIWPFTMAEIAETVAGLETVDYAEVIVGELLRYAGELVILGSGVVCYGAFDRYRGMLLGLLGRNDEAVAALTAGLALEEAVESPPLTTRTRYWLALALRNRDGPDDRARAAVELGRAREAAEQLCMATLARACRELV